MCGRLTLTACDNMSMLCIVFPLYILCASFYSSKMDAGIVVGFFPSLVVRGS